MILELLHACSAYQVSVKILDQEGVTLMQLGGYCPFKRQTNLFWNE
jgi:hypothetical protein